MRVTSMRKIKLDIRLAERNNKEQLYALVDDDDFEKQNQFNWSSKLQKRKHTEPIYYVYRRVRDSENKRKFVMLHREIMKCPDNLIVDHINHNGLDNRKENLRICSIAENVRNCRPMQNQTSKYKGVSWNKHTNRWRVKITHKDNSCVWIGQSFLDEVEAAKLYDAAAYLVYKEFAFLNFGKPTSQYLKKAERLINSVLNRTYASKYRGVSLEEGRWRATIHFKGEKIALGKYGVEVDAAKAYDKKARELLGAEAKLNFP